ncbi:MAG: TorF family putative porin [Pseudomonadota bacterium]
MIKYNFLILSLSSLLLSTHTAYCSDYLWFYNLSIKSDYRSRGISQTGNKPALQAAIDFYHQPSGFLSGIWISNVDSSKQGFDGANFETDFYLGWEHIWENTTVKLLAYRYQYFNTRIKDYNTNEYWFIVKQSFKQFTIEATATYSDNWYGTGHSNYYIGELTLPILKQFSFSARYGRNTFSHILLESYSDYEIKISCPILGLNISLSYINNNINKNYCYQPFNCDTRFVFSLSKDL